MSNGVDSVMVSTRGCDPLSKGSNPFLHNQYGVTERQMLICNSRIGWVSLMVKHLHCKQIDVSSTLYTQLQTIETTGC